MMKTMLRRFLDSAATTDTALTGPQESVDAWIAARRLTNTFAIEPIAFSDLDGWSFAKDTGDLEHRSGGFFRVRGLQLTGGAGHTADWSQPIIDQPEVGILGILVKEIDGVLFLLMQAKMEPGNINTLQLSPTVQATFSNYRRVHGGSAVPYLEYFTELSKGRVLVDVLQSEQGARFHRKRNRNMIVETDEDVPLLDDYRWMTVGQVHAMLRQDNMVNMDARSVLACLPLHGSSLGYGTIDADAEPFARSVVESIACHQDTVGLQNWLNHQRGRSSLTSELVPLSSVKRWHRSDTEISHEDGRYFKVIAASVQASSREVRSWTQPLIAPQGQGLIAFLATRVNGMLELLMQARPEAGVRDGVELAATVQCTPDNYAGLAPEHQHPYLDYVTSVAPERIRYDVLLSEEGGRFHHIVNRYLIVEVGEDIRRADPPSSRYRWATLGQLGKLVSHSGYLNIEARTLLACTHTLC
jgi:oxidase EvaA